MSLRRKSCYPTVPAARVGLLPSPSTRVTIAKTNSYSPKPVFPSTEGCSLSVRRGWQLQTVEALGWLRRMLLIGDPPIAPTRPLSQPLPRSGRRRPLVTVAPPPSRNPWESLPPPLIRSKFYGVVRLCPTRPAQGTRVKDSRSPSPIPPPMPSHACPFCNYTTP